MPSVTVHAPATVANLVCGFDILGLALDNPNDLLTLSLSSTPGIRLVHTDNFGLPTDPQKNIVGVVLMAIIKHIGNNSLGFDAEITKIIKPGSGLGSSAASAAATAVAANYLLGEPFSKTQLVEFAMEGEMLAGGSKHADNVAPCIYGGITLVRSTFPLDIVSIPYPPLYIAAVHPQIELKTADARQILRQELSLKEAVVHWGNVAGLVTGLHQGNYDLIGRSLQDHLVEPRRSLLIPLFDTIKTDSINAGALGGGISGSGPSMFMLCKTPEIAQSVCLIMKNHYQNINLNALTYCTQINNKGVTIVNPHCS